MRLRSDIWVSAYIRRCEIEGASAVLRRRGAAEAGAIFVKIDRLDGRAALYEPAPQSLAPPFDVDRLFVRAHKEEWVAADRIEARLTREAAFDPDIWIVEVEDRAGTTRLDVAP